MASSRLERIGTIFSRVEGLLRSKAMKPEDRPIWWDVYRAFPPTREPTFASPRVEKTKITPIFYKEDVIRAKYHKSGEPVGTVNLADSTRKSNVQHFIEIYNNKKSGSNENTDALFEETLETLKQSREIRREEWIERKAHSSEKRTSFSTKKDSSANIKDIFD